MNSDKYKVISSSLEYENPFMAIYKEEINYPSGITKPYWILKRFDFSIIIPLFPDKTTVIVGQYRIPIRKYSWEFPMGFVPGVSPLKAAQEELKEETGFTAQKWNQLASYYIAPGHNTQRAHIFIAEDLEEGEPMPGDTEFFEIKRVPLAEVKKMIKDGIIIEGPTIVAYHFMEGYLEKLTE